MNGADKVGALAIVMTAFVLFSLISWVGITSIRNNAIEKDKISACANAGMEWRPITRPNTTTVDMGCVAPERR